MKHRPHNIWTPEQDAVLRARFPHERTADVATALGLRYDQVNSRADRLHLRKTKAFLSSAASGRTDGGVGKATRFKAGHTTWNKGKRYIAGGRSAETRFRSGDRTGRAAEVYRPIGTERITDDGYRHRKISDTGPMHKRWRGVHLLNWEAVNGPLPPGHAITFRDGRRSNCEIDNLILVTRAEMMARNTIHNRLPPELRAATNALGQLKRRLREHQERLAATTPENLA